MPDAAHGPEFHGTWIQALLPTVCLMGLEVGRWLSILGQLYFDELETFRTMTFAFLSIGLVFEHLEFMPLHRVGACIYITLY